MPAEYREARVNDASGIAEIVIQTGWFPHLETEPFSETRDRIKKHLALCLADNSHSVFVAVDKDGRPIAYAAVHWLPDFFLKGPEGYLSDLFVRREFRGKEIGGRLLGMVIDEAKKRGCARLSLLNNRERESYQRNFYKDRGWVERDTIANLVYYF
jgi:GNAT superfamily N-acetyltransferase